MENKSSIDNYYNDKISKSINIIDSISQKKIQYAKNWASKERKTIITPTKDLEQLEQDWINYNSMTKDERRDSDWVCMELFGVNNRYFYNILRSSFADPAIGDEYQFVSDTTIDSSTNESAVTDDTSSPTSDILSKYYDIDNIVMDEKIASYNDLDVTNAKIWSNDSYRVIITPTNTLNELENLWDAFCSMPRKHQRESDWKSIELFSGLTNFDHYKLLKSRFLAEDIPEEQKNKIPETGIVSESYVPDSYAIIRKNIKYNAKYDPHIYTYKLCLEEYIKNNTFYEETELNNIISDVITQYEDQDIVYASPNVIDRCGDLPCIGPDQMIDRGVFGRSMAEDDNFYGVLADNTMLNDTITIKEWFNMYRDAYNGYYSEFYNYIPDWISKVNELYNDLRKIEMSEDIKAINAKKQSLLELGWVPEVEYNNQSRIYAKKLFEIESNRNMYKTVFRDIRKLYTFKESNELVSSNSSSNLLPVYIFLFEGHLINPNIINVITGKTTASVGICIDPEFQRICRRNTDGKLYQTSINELNKGNFIGVYTFFLKDDKYNKIVELLRNFNDINTSYVYDKFIKYIFDVPYDSDIEFICSNFADRCMTVVDMMENDGRMSNDEVIKTYENNEDEERYIYNIYKGSVKEFDVKQIKNSIKSLTDRACPLKESISSMIDFYTINESNYIQGLISNISNIEVLNSLKEHTNLITNKNVKKIVDKLFESIDIKPYRDYSNLKPYEKNKSFTLKEISKITKSIVKPI